MVELALSIAKLFGAFALVLLNGFFVAAEFAYVRIRSTAVDSLVEEGRTGSAILEEAVDNLDSYLAVTQLGITIASLGLGWIGEPAVADLLDPVLAPVFPSGVPHVISFAIAFSFITFLHVVFGELAPKTISIARAERVALLVSPPMKVFYYLFIPGLVVFNGTANYFTRLIGIPPASETDETLTEEELRMVLTRSGRKGHIDAEEVDMIERVFELDDTSVREVMVPRPDVVDVDANTRLPALGTLVREAGHTRYPVLEDDETVVGFVDVKDLLFASESTDDVETATAAGVARELPIVPETTTVVDLLEHFQRERVQMAAVTDEWGVFEGIVTVEDVVEEIVGDIRDGFDADEPAIERRDDGTYVVDGGVSVTAVNDRLEADIEAEEVATIGGLVLERLGRIPEAGDVIGASGYTLEVDRVDGARVSSVVIREGEPAESSSDDGE